MKRVLLSMLVIVFTTIACNDGDIIVKDFDFDDVSLKTCGEIGSYVFFKENPQSHESLSLLLNVADDLYSEPGILTYSLNGTSNVVHYRRYDGPLENNHFCSNIPPSTPAIIEEYKASSGLAEIIVTFEYIDNTPPIPRPVSTRNSEKQLQQTLHKHVRVVLKDLVLVKGDEQIIVETLDMGTINDIEVIEL